MLRGAVTRPPGLAVRALHDFLASTGLQQVGETGVWVGLAEHPGQDQQQSMTFLAGAGLQQVGGTGVWVGLEAP
jgi:hypothetical protein